MTSYLNQLKDSFLVTINICDILFYVLQRSYVLPGRGNKFVYWSKWAAELLFDVGIVFFCYFECNRHADDCMCVFTDDSSLRNSACAAAIWIWSSHSRIWVEFHINKNFPRIRKVANIGGCVVWAVSLEELHKTDPWKAVQILSFFKIKDVNEEIFEKEFETGDKNKSG